LPKSVLPPLLGDPVAITRRLRDHQEADRFFGVILKLVVRPWRNSYALSGQQNNLLAIGFHDGLAGQNEEKLLGVPVEVTHLGGAGRHMLFNHAQVRLLQ
jgi:hypothetical protein